MLPVLTLNTVMLPHEYLPLLMGQFERSLIQRISPNWYIGVVARSSFQSCRVGTIMRVRFVETYFGMLEV